MTIGKCLIIAETQSSSKTIGVEAGTTTSNTEMSRMRDSIAETPGEITRVARSVDLENANAISGISIIPGTGRVIINLLGRENRQRMVIIDLQTAGERDQKNSILQLRTRIRP